MDKWRLYLALICGTYSTSRSTPNKTPNNLKIEKTDLKIGDVLIFSSSLIEVYQQIIQEFLYLC